ncbi:hypothetical protein U1Q18_010686, partial [Sarracenia purpurea var. burkii]
TPSIAQSLVDVVFVIASATPPIADVVSPDQNTTFAPRRRSSPPVFGVLSPDCLFVSPVPLLVVAVTAHRATRRHRHRRHLDLDLHSWPLLLVEAPPLLLHFSVALVRTISGFFFD